MIMQRQVLQSCFDPGWCLSFSSSTVWTVYEMACSLCFPLLCTETGTHRAFFARFGVLQYIDKVVDVWGTRYFLRVARALRLESGRYFLSPLFWQPLAPVRCDSPRKLLDEFRLFST